MSLQKFLDMSAGVPSHDRLTALNAIQPDEFEPILFAEWMD